MDYIGIDIGTTSVKLLRMDEAGAVKAVVSREYPLEVNNRGWSQQNPADWWAQTVSALKEITAIRPETIAAVSFSGQMHGLVTLDGRDNVIRPAILWNDQRTQAECDYLNNVIGRDALIAHTANVALTGFTAPKILWMRNNEPENFRRIAKIMLPKDYIAYRLTGVHATDTSDASGMLLLDVEHRQWSVFMLELLGISEKQLPQLYESHQVIGAVLPEVAAATGLPAGCKVVIGGGDQAVGAVGTGTVQDGMCSVSLGTSGVVFLASDSFRVDASSSALHSFCHASGRYHLMGVTLAAAASYQWWIESILQTKDHDGEQLAIGRLGDNAVYFLPYLNGERTPHNDPAARGLFVGMNMTTSRADMTQAVMEGVIFSLRDTVEAAKRLGLPVTRARIIGGGAKSALWCQMTADIFGVPVEKIQSQEGPALGAAILAAVGGGAYPSVEEACRKLIKTAESFAPDPLTVERYDERYRHFAALYGQVKDVFTSLRQA